MPAPPGFEDLQAYPLLEAMGHRRSRRFALGAEMPEGPLGYQSRSSPVPLSTLEEAVLVHGAAGLTGFCAADLPYRSQEEEQAGGNVMAGLRGRAIPSADAIHSTSLFIINDEATWHFPPPRPEDPSVSPAIAGGGEADRMEAAYLSRRVKVREGRVEIPRRVPEMFPFNRWSTNLPGTTYFVPVSDLTALCLNVLFSAFDEQMALYILDERKGLRPAGIAKFAKSRGGRLHDDPADRRVLTILMLESYLLEFVLAEQAFMGQQMMLLEQGMGLGGWSHFASADPNAWFRELGFTMGSQLLSQTIGAGCLRTWLMTMLGMNASVPFPIGLACEGRELIRPFCPPQYRNMREAVLAFLDQKMANLQSFVPDQPGSAWKDERHVKESIPGFTQPCIDAVIAYCEYVWDTYGRFPAHFGPCRTTLAHQAHHLDLDFYDTHFDSGICTTTQRRHMERWHPEG
ncbi:MAG: hypothetical protein JNK37_25030 [Verrucomicrobiales bacterium]|nr:hypothetical protein [Verrucomicrobiales bacterium]